jgi:hypothetical protein
MSRYSSSRGLWFNEWWAAFLLLAVACCPLRADELSDRAASFWKPSAFKCKSANLVFPSKYSSLDPDHCDDGDMTLFNGLLCASGEEDGCTAVANSQQHTGQDKGRWWRSPRQIGWESTNGHGVSFSPDQALGVLLYVITTKNGSAFDDWVNWINNHRQSVSRKQATELLESVKASQLIIQLATAALMSLPPHPTYCTDDHDLRCALRPIDCELINAVGASLDRHTDVCRDYLFLNDLSAIAKTAGLPLLDVLTTAGARLNDLDYPLHLAAVELFLQTKMQAKGVLLPFAKETFYERDNQNPFFAYLAGKTAVARSLILKEPAPQCPTRESPSSGEPQQWSWERPSSKREWRHSMYWDCIFMANILSKADQ